jgi:hypothetical protein
MSAHQILLYLSVSGNFHEHFIVISLLSFCFENKSGSVVLEQAALDRFLVHVPDEV